MSGALIESNDGKILQSNIGRSSSQALATDQEKQNAMAVMSSSKNANMSEQDLQMMVALRQLRTYFLNGEFRAANTMLADRLMRQINNQDQINFYNICLIYTMHKLKEFQNSRQLAKELLQKLEK